MEPTTMPKNQPGTSSRAGVPAAEQKACEYTLRYPASEQATRRNNQSPAHGRGYSARPEARVYTWHYPASDSGRRANTVTPAARAGVQATTASTPSTTHASATTWWEQRLRAQAPPIPHTPAQRHQLRVCMRPTCGTSSNGQHSHCECQRNPTSAWQNMRVRRPRAPRPGLVSHVP